MITYYMDHSMLVLYSVKSTRKVFTEWSEIIDHTWINNIYKINKCLNISFFTQHIYTIFLVCFTVFSFVQVCSIWLTTVKWRIQKTKKLLLLWAHLPTPAAAVWPTCWKRQNTSTPPSLLAFSGWAISHELWCCYHHGQLSGWKAGSASLTVVC